MIIKYFLHREINRNRKPMKRKKTKSITTASLQQTGSHLSQRNHAPQHFHHLDEAANLKVMSSSYCSPPNPKAYSSDNSKLCLTQLTSEDACRSPTSAAEMHQHHQSLMTKEYHLPMVTKIGLHSCENSHPRSAPCTTTNMTNSTAMVSENEYFRNRENNNGFSPNRAGNVIQNYFPNYTAANYEGGAANMPQQCSSSNAMVTMSPASVE